jgi:hypothetical protein
VTDTESQEEVAHKDSVGQKFHKRYQRRGLGYRNFEEFFVVTEHFIRLIIGLTTSLDAE